MTTKRVIIKSMDGYSGEEVRNLINRRITCQAEKNGRGYWQVSSPHLSYDYLNFNASALEFLPDATVADGTDISKLQAAVDEAQAALAKAQERLAQMTPKEEPKKEDPHKGFFVGQKVVIKESVLPFGSYESRLGTVGKIVELMDGGATVEFPEASFNRTGDPYQAVWLYRELEPAPWHASANAYDVIRVGKGYLAADGEHIVRDMFKAKLTPAYAKHLREDLGITDTSF